MARASTDMKICASPDGVSGKCWEVVGGSKGGLLVRMGEDLDSQAFEFRLETGSIILEWEVEGNRMHYELLQGRGPDNGWVSTQIKDKLLLAPFDPLNLWRPLGAILPPIHRTLRCPGVLAVPERFHDVYINKGPSEPRQPRLYVFLFPGAEDEVRMGWLDIECEAPVHVEVATYEMPGHGARAGEPFLRTLQEVGDDVFQTFKDAMRRGTFVVAGHSNGVLVMTYVCQRAQRELNASPSAALALDRGPPDLTVFTEAARGIYDSDPEQFARAYNRHLLGRPEALAMRMADTPLCDDVRPVGWYRYPCPLHVLVADWGEWPPPEGAGEQQEIVQMFAKYHRTGINNSFTVAEQEGWRAWVDTVEIKQAPGLDHRAIKQSAPFLETLYKAIDDILWVQRRRGNIQ